MAYLVVPFHYTRLWTVCGIFLVDMVDVAVDCISWGHSEGQGVFGSTEAATVSCVWCWLVLQKKSLDRVFVLRLAGEV